MAINFLGKTHIVTDISGLKFIFPCTDIFVRIFALIFVLSGKWKRTALFLSIMMLFFQTPCLADKPIKIGVSLGLTGRFAVISGALNRGFKLWERNVNHENGILGRPVKVIVKDDQSDPGSAVSIYRDFIEKEYVDFLFAPYSSLITEAVLPIAEKNDMPLLIAGAAADRLWEKGYCNAIGVYTAASKFTIGFFGASCFKRIG